MTDRQIVCIYCGQSATSSREHVLQKALGGSAVIDEVCQPCNGGFSDIDQSLAERSLVSLTRLTATSSGKPVQLGSTQLIFDPELNTYLEVRLGNGFTPTLLPQLHLREPHDLVFRGADAEQPAKLSRLLEKAIKMKQLKNLHVVVDPTCKTVRITKHRSRDLFVRAASEAQGQQFLRTIEDHWPKVQEALAGAARAGKLEQPQLEVRMQLDLNAHFRAAAKIAFNTLALGHGGEYVRRAVFDPLKAYISGKDVVLPEVGPGGIAVDERFVSQYPDDTFKAFADDSHCVLIMNHPAEHALQGVVILYGKHVFVVRLGPEEQSFTPYGHEFSTDGSSHRELSLEELAMRVRKLRKATSEQAVGDATS